jgi:peptidoglycan/xylan/chitin deacetylase (PgdA/CDA1 family)
MSESTPRTERFSWPQGKKAAAALSFDVDAETPLLYADPSMGSRLGLMTHQMFGPLVGVPRILDLLARHQITSTFFVPGYTAERYPELIRRIVDEGHEIGHHGYLHEPLQGLSVDEERRLVDKGLESLDKIAGVRPTGFRAPMGEMSFQTPGVLAERGFVYDSSLMDSDAPYLLGAGDGSLVELPFHWSTDDWEQYNWIPDFDDGRPIETPEKTHEVWRAELDGQLRYGGLFNLVNHPFVSGRAARITALEALVERLVSDTQIWFARLDEIAAHVLTLDLPVVTHPPYRLP